MARIRTIKPEFFTSEDIVALSPLARLLYIALWCECDKEGRMLWKPRTFKMRYFPADDCDIDALCKELIKQGLVRLYGEGLAYIPGFTRHQHVNPRESASELPAPPDYEPTAPKRITSDVRAEVMARDGHKCVRCNATEDLTLDHILPQCLDGPHLAENLRVMCRGCNSGRPVSGKGLVEDLATDGFTIQGLRQRFGIDKELTRADASRRVNSRTDAQGGREGKGKEGDTRDASVSFEVFWSAYPLKKSRADALKAWVKLNPSEHLQASILKAIAQQSQGEDWLKEGGRFIPHASTWLNGKRWDDEVFPGASSTIHDIFAGAK